jgi:uncharacterized membrane protein
MRIEHAIQMDRNLLKILAIIAFVIIFGGWQGLYNLAIGVWFILGLIVVILITFFWKDLIIAGLKAIFYHFFSKRRR